MLSTLVDNKAFRMIDEWVRRGIVGYFKDGEADISVAACYRTEIDGKQYVVIADTNRTPLAVFRVEFVGAPRLKRLRHRWPKAVITRTATPMIEPQQ